MILPQKIGKYEIHGELGQGAMGKVYKGFDPHISRWVAIKAIVKASLAPVDLQHMISRFRHEARAVGKLIHPRIVQIYDYGEDEELAYIVMELVNGKSLHQFLANGANYSQSEIVEIIRPLLDALGYVHAEGVVHRDLKPSNILINNDGRIKICDFGIAHTETSELTQLGDVLGSLHYMSPEQFIGMSIDARSDLYSVGVIAYELLTGKKPFDGNSVTVMQQVIYQREATPSSINPALTPEIDAVLAKALEKDPDKRFQTAGEFSQAFVTALSAGTGKTSMATGAAPISRPPPGLLNAARMINAQTPSAQTPYTQTPNAQTPVNPASRADDKTELLIKTSDMQMPSSAADLEQVATATEPQAAVDTAGHFSDNRARQASILAVDDDERILNALKSLFRKSYNVFTTTSGIQALDFLKRHKIHVIISDQRMPIMPGVEVLRQARELSPSTVRILLTGYSDLASIVGSINDGEVYRFISKPWDNQDLQQTVSEAVTIALELANTASATTAPLGRIEAGVLVIDADEEIFRITKGVMDGLCPVLYAPDLDKAIAVMQQQEIAVVLADVGGGNDDMGAMIKLLKQENPQILTVVLTAASDSDLVIELINQAQIFRFLNKPVKVGLLKRHLHAALEQYVKYQKSPELLKLHRVKETGQVRDTTAGKKILAGLMALPKRWFKFE
jgi:eukaryotic-like serine/threonine-protein kinase